MKQSNRNFWLDVTAFITFLITTITGFLLWLVIPHKLEMAFLGFSRGVWVAAHICSGVVVLIIIVIHIVWHWDWLRALRGRSLSGMPDKLRANRITDRVMWITYITANASGGLAWMMHFDSDVSVGALSDRLHGMVGVVLTFLVIMHLALHWKWITSTTRRYMVLGLGHSSPIQ